jgi:cysteine synthase A
MARISNILGLIGNTPLLRLERLTRGLEAEVYVKLEYLNPSGSIKDRVALRMVEDAERRGQLRPGTEIVESSTGNTGTSLAFVGAAKGYAVGIYVPRTVVSEERQRILKSYGAHVVPVDIEDVIFDSSFPQGVHGARVELIPRRVCAQKEAADTNVWWARQFSNPSNPDAHRCTTGPEILSQLGAPADAFVAAIGTGGTILGVADVLRAASPSTTIVAAEPARHRTIVDGQLAIPVIQGISGGLLLEILERSVVDQVMPVDEADAIGIAHALAEQEGLFCGMSSGANVYAAMQLAREMKKGQCVVTVLPDSRDRYLFNERLTT